MARRTGLREFQLAVAERLRTASTHAALASKLGFQVGPKPAAAPAWVGSAFTDKGGTRWLELDLPALVREQRFLEVGA